MDSDSHKVRIMTGQIKTKKRNSQKHFIQSANIPNFHNKIFMATLFTR
jgi:hypothetical protein